MYPLTVIECWLRFVDFMIFRHPLGVSQNSYLFYFSIIPLPVTEKTSTSSSSGDAIKMQGIEAFTLFCGSSFKNSGKFSSKSTEFCWRHDLKSTFIYCFDSLWCSHSIVLVRMSLKETRGVVTRMQHLTALLVGSCEEGTSAPRGQNVHINHYMKEAEAERQRPTPVATCSLIDSCRLPSGH